jgi:hypothetical protein
MPIPQVTDRIKEAPAVALRAVFAGIGQLLMVLDKIRAQLQEQATSSAPADQKGPGTARPARRPADETGNVALLHERPTPAAPRPAAARADATGTRPAPAASKPAAAHQPAAPKQATAHTRPSAPKPGTAPATKTKPAVATKPASAPAAKPAEAPKATAPKPTSPPKPTAAPEARPAAPAATIGKPAPAASAAAQTAPIPGYDGLSIASLRARLRGLDAAGVHALLDYEKANAHRDDVITMFERRLSKIGDGAS